MKFDLEQLMKEAVEDNGFWQDRTDVLLSQDEINQRLQQAQAEGEQSDED